MKRFSILVFLAAMAASLGYAQQSKVTIHAARTPAESGKAMFVSYCAPCHGVDARGQGVTASVLKIQPSDLTVLSRNNNGKYPENHVVAVLRFGVENPAHGSKQMPIWGPVFRRLDDTTGSGTVALRVNNLVTYIKSLQTK